MRRCAAPSNRPINPSEIFSGAIEGHLGLDEDDWKDIFVHAMPDDHISRVFEGGFDPADHSFLETLNGLERDMKPHALVL